MQPESGTMPRRSGAHNLTNAGSICDGSWVHPLAGVSSVEWVFISLDRQRLIVQEPFAVRLQKQHTKPIGFINILIGRRLK